MADTKKSNILPLKLDPTTNERLHADLWRRLLSRIEVKKAMWVLRIFFAIARLTNSFKGKIQKKKARKPQLIDDSLLKGRPPAAYQQEESLAKISGVSSKWSARRFSIQVSSAASFLYSDFNTAGN
jgi:hypothetical protein